jgi:hypothetical protein
MTLAEPSSVLFETGPLASFEKEDGSGDPVEVRGLLENATEERETGDTRRQAAAWHFTCPSSEVAAYIEGDKMTTAEASQGIPSGTEFTILDRVADDGSVCTFLLHLPS